MENFCIALIIFVFIPIFAPFVESLFKGKDEEL